MTTIPLEMVRTKEKYEKYFEDGTAFELGFKEECVLNKLKNFHVTNNCVNDLMHDCQLGTINFILTFSIKYFLSQYRSSFSLDTLNERIQRFDCGEKEKKHVPSVILESHLSGSGLFLYASECSFLLRHFPLIIYGLIPTPDPVYRFILDTIDVIDKCFASQFDDESIQDLKRSIKDNRDRYKNLFNTHLKPKDHNMLHYDLCIENNGPLKYLTAMRAEGKHQHVRRYTNICKSRKNVCFSVAHKFAFHYAYFLHKNRTGFLSQLSSSNENPDEISPPVIEYILNQEMDFNNFVSCM